MITRHKLPHYHSVVVAVGGRVLSSPVETRVTKTLSSLLLAGCCAGISMLDGTARVTLSLIHI